MAMAPSRRPGCADLHRPRRRRALATCMAASCRRKRRMSRSTRCHTCRYVPGCTNSRSPPWLTANRCSWSNGRRANRCSEQGDIMSVAFELEFEACYPRLYALADQPARTAPSPRVRRRRVVLAAVVLALLVLLALPIRAIGGSTLAQSAPAPGQEYVVKAATRWRPSPPGWTARTWPGWAAAGRRGRIDRGRAGGAYLHSLTIVGGVRCPWCAVDDDRVVDSRLAEDGGRSGGAASASGAGAASPPSSGWKRCRCGW